MDNFHTYLKKQLLDYVEAERKKGVPLENIEQVLLNAGHKKNIIDEVFFEIKKENIDHKTTSHKDPVEKDIVSMVKKAFSDFMAQANKKEVSDAKKDFETTDTKELVKDVIEEAEYIEEQTTLEGIAFFIYLVCLGAIIFFTAGISDSSVINVTLGFLPAIINMFVSFVGVKLADNVPVYVFIPTVITSIFYGVARFMSIGNFEYEALGVLNFIFGLAFNIMIVYVRFVKPKHMKRRKIKVSKAQVFKDRKEISDLKNEFGMK